MQAVLGGGLPHIQAWGDILSELRVKNRRFEQRIADKKLSFFSAKTPVFPSQFKFWQDIYS